MAKRKAEIVDNSVIYEKNIEEVMHTSMIPYSEYVIMDRALPRVEDGLKPVQRRILYTLHELGITPDKPYKKSARIVGDCLGKYHPHGDTSVYDAMVRMAQPFNMRMTLVDGHGNFGSPDGDSAAAMRYTEARMGALAQQLLRDLDKDTVSWSWNFDDSLKEPDMLPGRFPNLLVNGTSGIAIGLSTNIPTHNLGEVIDGVVALMENPRITTKEMMKHIPGPDFPTGGFIVGGEGLMQAYETGKGKISIKAKIHIEDAEYEKKNIVITELPYQANKTSILKKIVDLRESKKDIYGGIMDIVDESDRNGIRAVIKVRKDADAGRIVQALYKHTDLQKTFAINMVAIANGKPMQLSLLEILKYYLEYQVTIIVRRTRYDLKLAKNRAEVVRGLLIAIANIDEVIRIIKKSPSTAAARDKLCERFKLSEIQANAILEMRLKALTGLESSKLEAELKDLEEKIEYYNLILSSKKEQYKVIRTELLEIKRAHKNPRKSDIKGTEAEVAVPVKTDEVEYREGVFVACANSTFKIISEKNYSMSQTDIKSCGEDELAPFVLKVNNRETVYAFSNLGNCFKISIDDFPEKKWRDKGMRLAEIHKDAVADERIAGLFSFETEPEGDAVIMTRKGMIKRTPWKDLIVSKTAYKVMNLTDDEVISVETLQKESIIMVTKEGLVICFGADEVPSQGRVAGGVRGINLSGKDQVVFAGQFDDEGEVIVVSSLGYAKRVISATIEVGTRYRKGNKIIELPQGEVVFAGIVKEPYDLAFVLEDGVEEVNTEDIRIDARTTRGKQVAKGIVNEVVAHKSKL